MPNPIEESAVRLERLHALVADGINPFPSASARTATVAMTLGRFDELVASGEAVTLTGRLRSVRGHGGAAFADLEDGSGKIQIHCKQDVLGAARYELFSTRLDIGDFLQVTGKAFLTRRGEKSLEAADLQILTKSLHPLPDKWHGLSDTEIRYRKRYLDLLANPEVRQIFRQRSLIVQAIRDFFHREGFMEVETPILQPIAGGATARPFITHHNALDIDLYLRIAPELYLKRLIVGGFERVFEVARCFRNEGIDHSHNPEFTQVEFYQAYADYRDLMSLTERLLPEIVAKACGGKTSVTYEGHTVDFTAPYPRITFRDALLEYGGFDIEDYPDRAALAKLAESHGVPVETKDDRGSILDNLYKKFVRAKIINPTFVIDQPVEHSPLAKRRADDPRYVERFQLVLGAGVELVNAFSELNDPIDQRARFEEQEKLREKGDEEAQHLDEDFIEALSVGMPPTAGFGMGIDRLTAVLTGSHNLKEVILFPTLRPQ